MARPSPQREPAGGARALGRQQRLERILSAAERLFAAQGFAQTTIDGIAAAAGVSKGLLYDHYASKEELLDVVWARLVERWTEATLRSAKLDDGSIAESIARVLALSIRHAQANPLLRRILAQDPGMLSARGRENALAFARLYREGIESLLARGVRSGELRRGLDVAHTAELIWLVHFALVRELFVGQERELRADAAELLESAVALLVNGLRASERRAR